MGWLIAVVIFAILFYVYAKWEAGHFKRKGIKNLPYQLPLIGNMLSVLMQKEHTKEAVTRVYRAFPEEKYVGYKQMNMNLIMIRDVELLKKVAIKDFDHFTDHLIAINEDIDQLFGKNLFALNGDKWHDMRSTLSPAFTSSKMKNMFNFVVEIGEQMAEFYIAKMKTAECKERGLVEIEMKDAFTRYTNDVIATAALGVRINSLQEQNNDIFRVGKELTNFGGHRLLKFFIYGAFPKIARFLGLQLMEEHLKDFFRKLVMNTMKERSEKNVIRQDMIHLLMEARKGALKYESSKTENIDAGFATVEESHIGRRVVNRIWSDEDMVAQALIFYLAGYETTSTLLSFMSHELACNPDIQRRLQDEVDSVDLAENGRLSYGDLLKMNYMDMVVTETLRKWPPVVTTDRKCIKEYTLPPSSKDNPNGCQVNPGESLLIPIVSIHYDPKYYPDPERFDPERFSDANKGKLEQFAFLPFGIGPRNCIGSRFALMEAKAVMFYLLKSFDFVKTAKTDDPFKLSPKSFTMNAENGFWVGLKPRY